VRLGSALDSSENQAVRAVGSENRLPYFKALLKMFEAALKISITLQNDLRDALLDRLDDVRSVSHNLGYGVAMK
jgi:hypothetical protein